MKLSKQYIALEQNEFVSGDYKIVPIRYEDRMLIMKWRNEQIYHLRQAKPLTEEDQNNYFNGVVSRLFEQDQPGQLLFSYLYKEECIGYGGLVHINWIDRNAEISFIINTQLEKHEFQKHWGIYLGLIEQVGFGQLNLHKLFTYAFDLRPHLYEALEANGYTCEAKLKEHCLVDNVYKSVVIHSKFKTALTVRRALSSDVKLTYEWAQDHATRENSFSKDTITLESHTRWFLAKVNDPRFNYYICEASNVPAGIVRFDPAEEGYVIGITIAPAFRGKGLAEKFIKIACEAFFGNVKGAVVYAYIKLNNAASIRSFEKAGFEYHSAVSINGIESIKYQLINDEK